jgi:hypothetical protein
MSQSSQSHNDIGTLLEKWFNTKQQIHILEEKCKLYKSHVAKVMNTNNRNVISKNGYIAEKRFGTRETIDKDRMPPDLWNRYSKRTTYEAYYISEKKGKKNLS